MHYFPFALPFLVLLFIGLIVLIVVIELGVLRYAYEKLGIHPRYIFALMLLSLLGSYINIPLYRVKSEKTVEKEQVVWDWGVPRVVPYEEHEPTSTLIAINVGGALIPAWLAVYLYLRNGLWLRGLIGIGIVTAVVHWLATPVKGVGITVPTFIPPLVAVFVAMILSWSRAAPLAYISGTLGTLLGADVLNLGHVASLGAPVASIGGAGTFDGVFLTGIIAVLLAPVGGPPRPPNRSYVQGEAMQGPV